MRLLGLGYAYVVMILGIIVCGELPRVQSVLRVLGLAVCGEGPRVRRVC